MSEFHGLWTHHNYLACTKSVSLQTVQVEHYTEDKKKKNPCPQFGTSDYTFMSSLILMVILKFVTHVQWHWFRVCSSSTCFIITCDHVELSQEILVGSKFSGGGGSHLVLSMLCSNLTPNNGNSDCMLCKLERAEWTAAMFTPTVWLQYYASWVEQNAQCSPWATVWLQCNASWVEQNAQCLPQQCDCIAMQAELNRMDSVHPNSVTGMQCKLGREECTMFTPTVWLQRNTSWVEQNAQCSP